MWRKRLNVIALLYVAAESFGIGASVPGFDAAEWGFDGRPNAKDWGVESHCKIGFLLLVEEDHAVDL